MRSFRFACRQLILHPWLSAAVVLVLALGISTTTAALSAFYQIVLRPIAAPEPEHLVDLSEAGAKPGTLICSPAGFCDLTAAFGLYAVLALNIAQRTAELGLRMALGAEPRDLEASVIRPLCRLALVGISLGTLGALAAGRVVASLLFEVDSYDPMVFAAAAVIVVTVVAAAAYLPVRRAARLSPLDALRYQ